MTEWRIVYEDDSIIYIEASSKERAVEIAEENSFAESGKEQKAKSAECYLKNWNSLITDPILRCFNCQGCGFVENEGKNSECEECNGFGQIEK